MLVFVRTVSELVLRTSIKTQNVVTFYKFLIHLGVHHTIDATALPLSICPQFMTMMMMSTLSSAGDEVKTNDWVDRRDPIKYGPGQKNDQIGNALTLSLSCVKNCQTLLSVASVRK